jgi:hypothetical protein
MTRMTARAGILASALLLVGTIAACNKKDNTTVTDTTAMGTTTATVAVDTAPLHVSDIQVGKGVGSDKKIGDQTTSFGVRDTDGAAKDAKLTAKWTYNGTQVVNESSQTISPTGGTTATEFHVDKKSAWPKGKYKVEVMLNGASAGTKDLEVK